MNTPAHVVFSLSLLGHSNAQRYAIAIAVGALMRDLLMVVFYGYQKTLGVPEHIIWQEAYFSAGWQNGFDLFNSIPLLFLCALLSWKHYRSWAMMFASMIIHCLIDLPVHHDDGHRHFFPFSDFRFQSPLSYWDPKHYGGLVSSVEVTLVLVGTLVPRLHII